MAQTIRTKIMSQKPGKAFGSPEMFPINLEFANGDKGQAYSPSANPPYNVGDEVDIEHYKDSKNNIKQFKVKKADGGSGSQPASQPSSQGSGTRDSNYNIGMRIGMVLNNVCGYIATKNLPFTEEEIMKHARILYGCSVKMENAAKGQPSVTAAATQASSSGASAADEAERERARKEEKERLEREAEAELARQKEMDEDVPF